MDEGTDRHTDEQIKAIYHMKNIAIVGMSENPEKPSHYVPRYLIEHGYTVIPVNPTASTILERRSFQKVSGIEDKVDVVDVFRCLSSSTRCHSKSGNSGNMVAGGYPQYKSRETCPREWD